MKDYPYVPGWRQNKENNKPAINHSILMLTTHGIVEGEWDGNEWMQYRWSCKVKDTEVLYWIHLEDLTQLEKEGQTLQSDALNEVKEALLFDEKFQEEIKNTIKITLQEAVENAIRSAARSVVWDLYGKNSIDIEEMVKDAILSTIRKKQ